MRLDTLLERLCHGLEEITNHRRPCNSKPLLNSSSSTCRAGGTAYLLEVHKAVQDVSEQATMPTRPQTTNMLHTLH